MILNGTVTDWIGYIQAIFYFILAGYLIFLTLKTKLTHVDEFRKKFVVAIFVLVVSVSIYVVFRNFFSFPEQFYEILVVLLFIGLFGFILVMIHSYRTLIDYVSDIIDIEKSTMSEVLKAFLIAVILDMISFAATFILNIIQYSWIELAIGRVLFIGFYFSAIYTFLLHQKIKNANINIMIYFGFGFLCFALMEFAALFVNLMKSELGWALINFTVIAMLAFFILGYLNFKKRMLASKQ